MESCGTHFRTEHSVNNLWSNVMNEDIIEYIDTSGGYLESLIKSRRHVGDKLLSKLDNLISLEIDMAVMAAEKARSEILKKNTESVVRPIKGK